LAAPPPKPTSLAARATFDVGGAVTTSAPLDGAISNGIYSVRVTPTGSSPYLSVDLGGYLGGGTRDCETAMLAHCNPDGPLHGVLALDDFDVRVKPLTSYDSGADDLPGGLTGMACHGTAEAPALVNYTFWLPLEGADGHWGMNANPRYQADAVTVNRVDRQHWVVTSPGVAVGAEGIAELVSFAHSAILRKSGPSHEGQYVLPFSFTITAPGAACPAS
jgi:hypothetical protein